MATTIANNEPEMESRSIATEWNWTDEYAFHKHCQKTVCSAWGYNGTGRTWNVLTRAGLPNLDNILGGTANKWQDGFKSNSNNITEDLRSILELIDSTASKVIGHFTLSFNDGGNIAIPNQTKVIYPVSNNTYNFNIGRTLELKAGGQRLWKFNTTRDAGEADVLDVATKTINVKVSDQPMGSIGGLVGVGSGNLDIDVDSNDLTLKIGSTVIGKAENIVMPQDKTITIDEGTWFDRNRRWANTAYSSGGVITIVPGTHVYRLSPTTHYAPQFNLTNYRTIYDVIEVELHICPSVNMSLTGRLVTRGDLVSVDGNIINHVQPATGWYIRPLTDKFSLTANITHVYVFRIDTWNKVIACSLAYITK